MPVLLGLFAWLFIVTLLPSVSAAFDRTKPFYLTAKLPPRTNGFDNPTAELKLFVCPTRISGKPELCIDIHGVQSTDPIRAHLVGSTIGTFVSSNGTTNNSTASHHKANNGTADSAYESGACVLAAFGASTRLQTSYTTETIQFAALECGSASLSVPASATTTIDATTGEVRPGWTNSALPDYHAHWELCPYTTKEPESKYRALSFIIGRDYTVRECIADPVIYARNIPAQL